MGIIYVFSWEYFLESGHTEYKQKCPHNISEV